uniref:Cytochrome P450 n=1 Tax=Plectus sambesii TaxID=2011161 RepID=A0A914VPX5_9BILA
MFLLLLAVSTIAFFFHHFYWKRRNLPPGPTPLPFLGNLHTIARNAPGYTAYVKWREQYGEVYTYWLSGVPVVAVTEYEALQETFVKDGETYTGRLHIDFAKQLFRGGNYGIIDTDGPLWKEQRRFSLHVLRDFGVGRNLMEERVMEEVREMCSKISADLGPQGKAPAVDFASYLDVCIGSIINTILFGYRFEGDKLPEFFSLKNMLDKHMRLSGSPLAILFIMFPFLRHFPPFRSVYSHMVYNRISLWKFFTEQIQEHEKDFDANAEPVDYVQAFLREMHTMEKDKAELSNYSIDQLINVCNDLWIAGMETTITTLRWGALYMIYNPDVQAKIHTEIDHYIGDSDREILMSDKNSLPYTSAAINEIQRVANILPMNLLHKTTRDTTIRGYKIAKGTICIPQISVVHLDPKVFPEPHRFDPTRFLNPDGSPKKVNELMPFSVGKRQCLGESLARMELFLVFANLMRKFKLSTTPGENPPSLEQRTGITVQPWPYKCCIEERRMTMAYNA